MNNIWSLWQKGYAQVCGTCLCKFESCQTPFDIFIIKNIFIYLITACLIVADI